MQRYLSIISGKRNCMYVQCFFGSVTIRQKTEGPRRDQRGQSDAQVSNCSLEDARRGALCAEPRVRVLGCGVAALLEGPSGGAVGPRVGPLSGSPIFAAPELFKHDYGPKARARDLEGFARVALESRGALEHLEFCTLSGHFGPL